MDKFGIERAMIGVAARGDESRTDDSRRALREHPDRFFGCIDVDPNRGMDAVRDMVHAVEELGVKAASAFPCGLNPQVPINDKKFFPIYAKCVELDIPINVSAGVPGPRVPFAPQYVGSHRRGVLVLPRAEVRHPPRLRAVGRPRGEAAAEVAEPLLLDVGVRAEVLPEGRHPLREHARRRQGDVRRATSRWGSRSSASSATCPTCRSATTCGRSSCARTRSACSSWTRHEPGADPEARTVGPRRTGARGPEVAAA